jgi:uncharacterized protein YjiS (DUF1127 family)
MSTCKTPSPRSRADRIGSAPIGRVMRLWSDFRTKRTRNDQVRRLAAELNAYSESELAEIGLLRCDVKRFARQAVCAS